MKAAILSQPGFLASTSAGGIHDINDALAAGYPDRSEVWLGLRPHYYNLDRDVESIIASRPQRIIHIGHSYGCGQGLIGFAGQLAKYGRVIDLAVMIDPVVETFWWRLTNALINLGPFTVPANVNAVIHARTKNWRFGMPVGRDVTHHNVLMRMVFSASDAKSIDKRRTLIDDPTIIHTNIDAESNVRAMAAYGVRDLIGE